MGWRVWVTDARAHPGYCRVLWLLVALGALWLVALPRQWAPQVNIGASLSDARVLMAADLAEPLVTRHHLLCPPVTAYCSLAKKRDFPSASSALLLNPVETTEVYDQDYGTDARQFLY